MHSLFRYSFETSSFIHLLPAYSRARAICGHTHTSRNHFTFITLYSLFFYLERCSGGPSIPRVKNLFSPNFFCLFQRDGETKEIVQLPGHDSAFRKKTRTETETTLPGEEKGGRIKIPEVEKTKRNIKEKLQFYTAISIKPREKEGTRISTSFSLSGFGTNRPEGSPQNFNSNCETRKEKSANWLGTRIKRNETKEHHKTTQTRAIILRCTRAIAMYSFFLRILFSMFQI